MRSAVLGGVLAFAALWPATAVAPVAAASGHRCAAWHSRNVPPPTIRVWVKRRGGYVVTRDFRRYVAEVMAAGAWPGQPFESAKAGALAIKQYAWWEVLHRPCDRVVRNRRTGKVMPYDIENGGIHQLWRRKDGLRRPTRRQFAAVDAIWWDHIEKHGRFIRTGWYGGGGRCGRVTDGWHIGEDATRDCAKRLGWGYRRIIARYYSPRYRLISVKPR